MNETEFNEKIRLEGNIKLFIHRGLQCVILRAHAINLWRPLAVECERTSGGKRHSNLVHLCGYVRVPKSSKLYGLSYTHEKVDSIRVHGGLTYADDELIPNDDGWWFGFDCAPSSDYSGVDQILARAFMEGDDINGTYRDMNYVTNETKKLAEQLKRRMK